ncbi:cytochrome p450 protein [Curvularia clavata]|uniref:Cytochrome p450 protein n=1 Tax=Curvularia clavata TaxID=95742 RepID=A0A9Q9DNE2_CURCL|nr:cytochrome p450 protein [Curvularia clavata]
MASILSVLGGLIALIILRFVLRAIYRVYFHPLSKFPGPKSYAATRIPFNIAVLKGSRHNVFQNLHRKYGPIVRINPDELSIIEPDAWKDIYGHGTKGMPGSVPHKAWHQYGTPINGSIDMLTAQSDKDHIRQRKIFTPAFSDRALKQQEPLFRKYINKLVRKLQEGVQEDPDKKFNLVAMYNFTTFDVMGDWTFGESLHMLDNSEYDPWVKTIFDSLRISSSLSILRKYPLAMQLFKKFAPASIEKKRRDHFSHSTTRVTKRLEKGHNSEGTDLWDLVLSQKDGNGLTRPEMDANSSLFMVAGTETTATILSGLTYLLLRNPEWMKKLEEEIRTQFKSADEMTMERLAALPYLGACIKESFRIYPSVPLSLPRQTPADGSTICGTYVPPNTIVAIPQYAMYMSERNFKRPTEFLPQRWLGDREFDDDQRQCLQPFSVGSRDCLGKNMAYHEMRLIAANVLYHFDIELCPESEDWIDQRTYILWQKKPLICKLRPVN